MYKNTSLWRVGILSVVISTASGIALAAWVQPTELPPGGNTPPPINTGSTPQIKEGNFSLGVGSTFSATQGLFGKVGIGLTSTPTEPLEVSGKIKTDKIQLGEKWSLSGVGDFYADDSWLRLEDKGDKGYYGGFAAENLWAGNLLYGGSLILGGGWRFAPGGMYAGDDWIRLKDVNGTNYYGGFAADNLWANNTIHAGTPPQGGGAYGDNAVVTVGYLKNAGLVSGAPSGGTPSGGTPSGGTPADCTTTTNYPKNHANEGIPHPHQ